MSKPVRLPGEAPPADASVGVATASAALARAELPDDGHQDGDTSAFDPPGPREEPRTLLGKGAVGLDKRTGVAKIVKAAANKVFPDHWSFMLGELALYSFLVLVITGIFLTFFFIPSMDVVTYDGPYAPLQGQQMSAAYESTLALSFQVKGGLLVRQIHHWAALVFIASAVVHMFRVFFTGAFRKPRELNWLVGSVLLILALGAGFSGYSLPDDVLSGNGLRIADGVSKSIPVVGSYMSYGLFGGEFPGEALIPRLFTVHVLVIPAAIFALVGLHLFMVVLHKHTQYPGKGRTERNVVGARFFPQFMFKAGGLFFIVFGVLALMGATMTINPVWIFGPYDPSPVSAGAQPDWYILFMEGALRLMPGQTEFTLWGFTFSMNVFIPAVVVPGILFGFLMLYPFFERWATGDKAEHHLADRPRNKATRTALGAALISEFLVLVLGGCNDIIAHQFHANLNAITWVLRFGFFIVPVVTFFVTKRICIGLQRRDLAKLAHGHESGRMVRDAAGGYSEAHTPISDEERAVIMAQATVPEVLPEPPREDELGVANPRYKRLRRRARASRFLYASRAASPAEVIETARSSHAHAIGPSSPPPHLDHDDTAPQLAAAKPGTGDEREPVDKA